ncbi:MAG: beta-Ala-His dipeptidase [Planctomycetota bacterium]
MTSPAVESLAPAAVWKFFSGLASVPRPSKKEEKVRAYMLELLAELGFEATEDATGNIVAKVPATPGCESAKTTVIQSHLDMVCEKNAGTEHDFENDPIRLVRDVDSNGEEIIRADGTTLGSDNGIGVAMSLAAATSPEVTHGPLELLFTIDEETGMTGAKALVSESFEARQLINLDSEEDDAIYIGCAGGRDTDLRWSLAPQAISEGTTFRVSVSGLLGGHSGCDIHENRGNAIQILARALLASADGGSGWCLQEIEGGSMRNAIPREAVAVISGDAASQSRLEAACQALEEAAKRESFESASLSVECLGDSAGASAVSSDDTGRILRSLVAIPSGVVSMHPKIPSLVQSSNNLSTIRSSVEGGQVEVTVGCLTRSSLSSAIDHVSSQVASIGRLSGAAIEHHNDYPGWEPDVDSRLLATTRAIYEEMFETEPEVAAIHAGLECGIIRDAVGPMDMVSFGPRIEGAHSPDERVYPASVEKSWRFLVAVLGRLASD